jgi:hypothetical protein
VDLEEEELHALGPGMNGESIYTGPHRNVSNTLGVSTSITNPRWRVDSMDGGGYREGGGQIEEGK